MDTSRFNAYDKGAYLRFSNPALIEKDLQTLAGILKGIKSDGVVTGHEHAQVLAWVSAHKEYEEKQPYKEVIGIIRQALADDVLTKDECDNILWFCNLYTNKSGYFDLITSGIQKLTGIIKGIAIDNEINMAELAYLDQWLEENEHLRNCFPYDELYNLTTSIIQDKVITAEEQQSFIDFSNALVGPAADQSNDAILSALKTGYCQIDPVITFQENTFCITGLSKKFKRREIAEKVELYGGYVVDNVSAKLNYLVVCDEKNSCWAFTCYGRKIEEAIKHRKKGVPLAIVHEYDLYDAFETFR